MPEGNALEQLGLPSTFAPIPAQVQFAKIGAPGPDGTTTIHVMLIDTMHGRFAFAFSPDSLHELGKAIIGQATGLSIASTVPASAERNGGHRP